MICSLLVWTFAFPMPESHILPQPLVCTLLTIIISGHAIRQHFSHSFSTICECEITISITAIPVLPEAKPNNTTPVAPPIRKTKTILNLMALKYFAMLLYWTWRKKSRSQILSNNRNSCKPTDRTWVSILCRNSACGCQIAIHPFYLERIRGGICPMNLSAQQITGTLSGYYLWQHCGWGSGNAAQKRRWNGNKQFHATVTSRGRRRRRPTNRAVDAELKDVNPRDAGEWWHNGYGSDSDLQGSASDKPVPSYWWDMRRRRNGKIIEMSFLRIKHFESQQEVVPVPSWRITSHSFRHMPSTWHAEDPEVDCERDYPVSNNDDDDHGRDETNHVD